MHNQGMNMEWNEGKWHLSLKHCPLISVKTFKKEI